MKTKKARKPKRVIHRGLILVEIRNASSIKPNTETVIFRRMTPLEFFTDRQQAEAARKLSKFFEQYADWVEGRE